MAEEPFGDFTGTLPSPEILQSFTETILSFYQREGRNLPWRRTSRPYHILVSELMLQQTQVPRVLKKWEPFITRFPDLEAVAGASLKDVLEAWRGLGYNRRAKALKTVADELTRRGEPIPRTVPELQKLPMIGPATARSIAVFAYNSPEIFIETNIRRVFIHFFFHGRAAVGDEEILPLHQAALYREDPRRWYNALMDYGTHLAAEVENPNLRSKGYSRQSAFSGSFRQLRGAVLRSLGEHGPALPEKIPVPDGFDYEKLLECLSVLEKEGFLLREEDGRYGIR